MLLYFSPHAGGFKIRKEKKIHTHDPMKILQKVITQNTPKVKFVYEDLKNRPNEASKAERCKMYRNDSCLWNGETANRLYLFTSGGAGPLKHVKIGEMN